MAAYEMTHTAGFAGRIGHAFSSLSASFMEWNDRRTTRNALRQLSDRELEDIGLNRDDIDALR